MDYGQIKFNTLLDLLEFTKNQLVNLNSDLECAKSLMGSIDAQYKKKNPCEPPLTLTLAPLRGSQVRYTPLFRYHWIRH